MESFPLNEARFVDLLRKLVALGPRLQNAPDAGLVPEERLAADVVREALAPAVASGFVQIEALAAPGHEARPSLVLTVNGTGRGSVGFVGAHFDVVPADRVAEGWTRDLLPLLQPGPAGQRAAEGAIAAAGDGLICHTPRLDLLAGRYRLTLDLAAIKQKGKAKKAAPTQQTIEVPLANIEKANLIPEI